VAQFIALPQLVQQGRFLHGVALQLLLHAGQLLGGGDHRIVALAALAVFGVPLALQLQLLGRQLRELFPQLSSLLPQVVQLGLMGSDIAFGLPVGGGELLHQRLPLIPVGHHIQPQPLQVGDAALTRVPLGGQSRLSGLLLADLLGQGVGLFQQIALAALALLRTAAQLGGPGFLLRHVGLHGGAALPVGLGALGQCIQLGLQVLAALLQRVVQDVIMLLLRLILQHQILRLALLGRSHLQLILGFLQLALGVLGLLFGGGQPVPHAAQLAVQFLQFVGAAQYAGAAADAAAGHGAAPVHHLSVQRDDAEAVAVLPRHGDAAVQILHHHGAAQQALEDAVILPVIFDQVDGQPHKAVFAADVLPQCVAPDGGHRQEGGPPAIALLQVADGGLAVLLPVYHDVLHTRAQRDLQRHRVLFLCLDQAGHRAVNAPQGLLLRRLHYQLYRVGEALVLLLHLRQQADAVFQRRRVHGQL